MENGNIKTDRRVIKTKKAIHRAMAELMTKKSINDISVKDVAELADINRKTFYNYYAGIYELVDEIENDIVEHFEELIRETDFEEALKNPRVVFDKLYGAISVNVELVDALFNVNNTSLSSKVLSKMIDLTRDAAVEHFHSEPEKTEYIIRFIFAGEIATYKAWYHSDRTVPIRELSETIGTLCTKGLDGILA